MALFWNRGLYKSDNIHKRAKNSCRQACLRSFGSQTCIKFKLASAGSPSLADPPCVQRRSGAALANWKQHLRINGRQRAGQILQHNRKDHLKYVLNHSHTHSLIHCLKRLKHTYARVVALTTRLHRILGRRLHAVALGLVRLQRTDAHNYLRHCARTPFKRERYPRPPVRRPSAPLHGSLARRRPYYASGFSRPRSA